MWRGFQAFLACLNVAVILTGAFLFYKGGWTLTPGNPAIEYKDFISIVLTALSLLVTILGAFIAILAVFGFNEIRKEARRIAKIAAVQAAEKEGTISGEKAAIQAALAYLKQAVPEQVDGDDYGKAAGKDQGGE
jgi:TRAP-type C4-dicarboxylate transport system permease small subunit